MPPSPSRRRSSSRETSHERVNSFGNALPTKPKDDELTLFADMQKTEIENFLLEPSEDFDESISKLSFFPDVKLGINVPARGECHDLLKVDGDKNDYEWLLTPPETPLFRSLDDEEQSAGHVSRGRAQSKAMHIPRSSTMDNVQRSSRSSASPSRLSLSPRSVPKTRSPNSASRASPPLSLQPPMPSQRPSTPPAAKKILAPPRSSPSSVSRRMSTGSSGPTLNGTRGASPVKTNYRSSPKPQGWQSNDPGFSYDAPPNLRTSLPDRPVSRSRGGSPTSFSGLDTGPRGRRQSLSPTPTRRDSSSHSVERDRLSTYSKASATSSGEDDLDSIQSISMGYSNSSYPAVKRSLAVMKTRTIASSKKPSKNFSPSSAPKRSFDSAVWLMDHRKAPQDRFRPLLSSVPDTTFGAGKINNVHNPMFSHNFSVTTSSNASSEHGATFGHYIHTDQEQYDLIGEWEADDGFRVHEDIFMFDKLDGLNEETIYDKSEKYVKDSPIPVEYVKSDKKDFGMEKNAANEKTYDGANSSQVVHGKMVTCSRCGKLFNAMDLDEKGDCYEECASKIGSFSADLMLWTTEEVRQHDDNIAKSGSYAESEPYMVPDSVDNSKQASPDHQTVNDKPLADCTVNFPTGQLMVDTNEDMLLGQEVVNHEENVSAYLVSDSLLGNDDNISFNKFSVSDYQQTELTSVEHGYYGDQMDNHNHGLPQCLNESDSQHNEAVSETAFGINSDQLGLTAHQNSKVESAEVTGISVLLNQKSSSNKWPVMEGRALATTNIVCSEPCYTGDSINMMKHSFGCDSSSASSSIDLGSSRQSDVRFERLRSGKKGDFEKVQLSSTMSRQSIASVSDMSISGSSASLCHQSDAIEDTCSRIGTLESSAVVSTEEDGSKQDALSSDVECSSAARPIVSDDMVVDLNSSSFDRSSETAEVISQNHSMGRMADNDHSSTRMCFSDTEMASNLRESLVAEGSSMRKPDEDTSDTTRCYLVVTPDQVKENFDDLLLQSEAVQASVEEQTLDYCCVSAISEDDVLVSRTGTSIMELPNNEKSPEAVQGSMKQIQRCFTLEEATDTILFCSSIVHDLAYKAATIALEQEQEPGQAESIRPTVAIVGKSIPIDDDFLKLPHRRTPNRKVKRKRLEGETTITETAEKETIAKDLSPVRSPSGFVKSSDNMKPPKLESKCNCVIM